MKRQLILYLGLALSTVMCGESDDSDETAATTPAETTTPATSSPALDTQLTTGSLALGYALSAISSTVDNPSTALRLESSESTEYPGCSNNGEPWDSANNQRTEPSNPLFSPQTFYCQLASDESVETVMGELTQNRKILCEIERAIGEAVEFTEAGNVYTNVAIELSLGCGWSQRAIDETNGQNLTATLTATALTEGDWQKQIVMEVPGVVSLSMLYTVTADTIAFKKYDTWSQQERVDSGSGTNVFVASDATGLSGGLVAINLTEGTLRAEIGGSYWSRRVRMYAKGTLNATTGAFESVDELRALQSNFDYSGGDVNDPSLYGEVASVSGTATEGFKYISQRYNCRSQDSCDISQARTQVTLGTAQELCLPATATCSGNTGLVWTTDSAQYDFLMIGVVWDGQNGSKTTFENWIQTAAIPTFTTVAIQAEP